MAGRSDVVQYLKGSQDRYGVSRPPFCRTMRIGSALPTIRTLDTWELLDIDYRLYPSAFLPSWYAIARIKGLIYIVRPLPEGWKRGDPTDVPVTGHKYWFAWQGPDYEFRGPLFDGPVGRADYSRSAWESANRDKRRRMRAVPAADVSPSQRSNTLPREVRVMPSQRFKNLPSEARVTSRRDASSPSLEISPAAKQDTTHAAAHPEAEELTRLTPNQEYSTILHIKIHRDRETYFSLRLSSARPQMNPNGPVTNESLFQKLTRTANRISPSLGDIQVLEATFHPGLLDKPETSGNTTSGDWPDPEPLMIIRGEEDTFEDFQAHVLAVNKLDKKVSWYVDLRVIAE